MADLGPDWAALSVVVPLVGAAVATALPRMAAGVGLVGTALAVVAAVALAVSVAAHGPRVSALGGWGAPLGVDLEADGLAALLVAASAIVGAVVAVASAGEFGLRPRAGEPARHAARRASFWPLWLALLAGLNAVFLSADLFNRYVALEIVGLAAVGLTVLSGAPAAVRAGLTYLCAGLVGSLLFLLGVGLLYAEHGRADVAGLAAAVQGDFPETAALAAMLTGLALKTAVFPLHFWLPAAHANALAPASALLSALAVKASLYAAIRLWTDVFDPTATAGALMGAFGFAAVVWGSLRALRARRLKLLVAYSTIAQIGLVVLAFASTGAVGAPAAWQGAVWLMVAHAAAKAAMFLAAGRIAARLGHDRIAGLHTARTRSGPAEFAFALAAVSLIGLPPSGGFVGKWLLLEAGLRSAAWWPTAAVIVATALSAAYFGRVFSRLLRFDAAGEQAPVRDWSGMDLVPLGLALAAALLGLAAAGPLALLEGWPA